MTLLETIAAIEAVIDQNTTQWLVRSNNRNGSGGYFANIAVLDGTMRTLHEARRCHSTGSTPEKALMNALFKWQALQAEKAN